jgi:hypothetical protein
LVSVPAPVQGVVAAHAVPKIPRIVAARPVGDVTIAPPLHLVGPPAAAEVRNKSEGTPAIRPKITVSRTYPSAKRVVVDLAKMGLTVSLFLGQQRKPDHRYLW